MIRRSRSLRGRLLLLILIPLGAAAIIAAAIHYEIAKQTSERLYDKTLLTVATTISRDIILSQGDVLADDLLAALTDAVGDRIYYNFIGPNGAFVTGYTDPPTRPPDLTPQVNEPLFFDTDYNGVPVRAVILEEFVAEPTFGGRVSVMVWQTVEQRAAFSLLLAGRAVLLLGIVLFVVAVVVWFGVNIGLMPLFDLRNAIAARTSDDLSPIRRAVPREVKVLVTSLDALFARLARAFADRDAFISDAAHQLRNPIAGIRAQAEAAGRCGDLEELKSRVADVVEAAQRTSRLTQQLLSLERVRGGSMHRATSGVDLVALVAETARNSALEAADRGVDLSFEVTGAAQPVKADSVMLSEAIENLIDNALKYGCRWEDNLIVAVTFTDDEACVSVTDQGDGIPPDERERVFDRFFRGSTGTDDGCGLGLAIVQEIALRHGGALSLADTAQGCRFELRLPLETQSKTLLGGAKPMARPSVQPA